MRSRRWRCRVRQRHRRFCDMDRATCLSFLKLKPSQLTCEPC